MNKEGEWLVQYMLSSTKLYLGVGKYPDKRTAIAAAYLALATHIDECCDIDKYEYYMSPLYFLEGGEDLGINVTYVDDGEHKIEAECTLVKLVENDNW